MVAIIFPQLKESTAKKKKAFHVVETYSKWT